MNSRPRFLITAGPTREKIDPFRFISNPSSGKMGYAAAAAAAERGFPVVLVSGPVALAAPAGVELVKVVSARDMRAAVLRRFPETDAVIMAAAVSDFRPRAPRRSKIKKTGRGLVLDLVPNPDILAELGRRKGRRVLIGFAAETDNLIDGARSKLNNKNLDLIVGNDISEPGSGFGSETNRVVVVGRSGEVERWPLLSKQEVAARLVEYAVRIYEEKIRS
ncbi:MAG TPA: bifunctional phosphopantothenoylcysteine decarboxylase/phosphopantothenate--cysteine ligase CoaBC [bacterium]|nr:bifunctional phosphopantothenoylcysteine decarboxylase/phosphopantothenate--cysteine ligase CoaBC [bacterium]HPJ72034.1 bifunctional phosphopantothenoylcysteine decarboxylase/phosphopantothenate--cysteine ligase CoaBC [bacterium]HPQ65133.1 bifunctional phosphopantothenoylcysteine decarboxylase/phosphopantothenate--cysteine ligase CoaBC [bacterium]